MTPRNACSSHAALPSTFDRPPDPLEIIQSRTPIRARLKISHDRPRPFDRFRRVVDRREHGEIAHTPLCKKENQAKLANLAFLSLYDNNLWSLRRISVLGSTACPLLVELDVGKNDLGELPEEFALLSHLERLWAEDNRFQAFPPAILRLRRLKELRLSGNALPAVPDAIGDALRDLEVLAVDNNRLTSLPDGVGRLTKLRKLIARGNAIEALPEALVARLAQLEVCIVSSNRLSELPKFEGCPKLRALYANIFAYKT